MDMYNEYKNKLPSKIIEDVKDYLKDKKVSDAKLRKILDRAVEEYKEAKVHPGESVGLVAAESIGEPGTQMSIAYDEKVLVKADGLTTPVKIGEFVDKLITENRHETINGSAIVNTENLNIFAPSLNGIGKIEWKKVFSCSRHKYNKKLITLKTRSGRYITATPNHSFVIRENNRIVPILGNKLKIGDRIPVVRNIPIHEYRSSIFLEEFLPKTDYWFGSELKKAKDSITGGIKHNFIVPVKFDQLRNYLKGNVANEIQEGFIYPYQTHSSNSAIPELLNLDSLFGWFVGAYLAEGSSSGVSISIANISDDYIKNAIKFAEKFKLGYADKKGFGEYGESRSLIINSTVMSDFFEKSCGKKSINKKVPYFAYDGSEVFISNLLKGYFDGDGNVSVSRKMLRASSKSKNLIDGVSLLLGRLGIFASKNKNSKGYNLSISYRYAEKFRNKIGFGNVNKKKELDKLCKIKYSRGYDIIDMIPGFGNLFLEIGKKLDLPSRFTNKLTKKQKIGRNTLLNYINKFDYLAKRAKINLKKELEILSQMADSDVVWDEIVEVRYAKQNNEYVYDFSVQGLETFTTFDGVITHNTLNTFHFAGVAEMNITLGLPRIIEILDGRKDIETPMMEIYLKKPYSTGKDVKELALSIKETKLEEISTEFLINLVESTITVTLDKIKMKELGITINQVITAIPKHLKGFSIKQKDDNSIILKSRSKEESLNEVYKAKEKVKEAHIKGVKNISQVLPVKRGEEFIIITAGSNLNEVLQLEEVDSFRTTTNNIFEIEEVLGIEAARQAIVDEVFKVIENQGLNIDVRHIMLVADTMCISGSVKGITRYGVVSEKSSVLARASFETPIKHIINAALVGEVDYLDSVVENVMLNQAVPVGTGLPGLVTKIKKKGEKTV